MECFKMGLKLYMVLNLLEYSFTETDSAKSVALVLFDLSAAFDVDDHEVLLTRLETSVGLRGAVLPWIRSYVTDRWFECLN